MHYSAYRANARMNWLNRLRSAKGFPVEPGLKIEDFLNSSGSEVQSPALSCSLSLDGSKTRKTSEKYQQNGALPKSTPDESKNSNKSSSVGTVIKKDLASFRDERKIESDVKVEDHSLVNSDCCTNGASLNGCLPFDERARVRSSVKAVKRKKASSIVKEADEDWFQITNNALAELFGMRDAYWIRKLNGRKHKRKQEKPRICPSSANPNANFISSSPLSSDDNRVEDPDAALKSSPLNGDATILTLSPLSADNSVVAGVEKKEDEHKSGDIPCTKANEIPMKRKGYKEKKAGVDNTDKNGHRLGVDISSYSCTEVTLIDTSIPAWKAEKVIYRKGTIWKVRDKKVSGSGKKSGSISSVLDSGKRKFVGSLDEVRSKRKGLRTCSFNLRAGEDDFGECLSIKVKTRMKMHSDYSSSSKDTDGHVERKTQVEEEKDNVPQTRHSRNRRLCTGSADCSEDGTAVEVRPLMTEASSEAAPQNNLSPDHPVNQPIETLLFSIYQVFLQAGKTGLTAREAVSRILERGLPGLHEGGVVPRVEVAKILRTSPYFMQLEESKFVLCSAIIGNEGQNLCSPVNLLEAREKVAADETQEDTKTEKKAKQSGSWQYWAALAAIRRVRTRRRSVTLSQSTVSPCLSRESVGGEGEIHCS